MFQGKRFIWNESALEWQYQLPPKLSTCHWCKCGHNNLRLFDILINFLSPQVEGSLTISNEKGIYELPHELTNNLRKLENFRKISKLHDIIAWCLVFFPKWKFCQCYCSEKRLKARYWAFLVVRYFIWNLSLSQYLVHNCSFVFKRQSDQ